MTRESFIYNLDQMILFFSGKIKTLSPGERKALWYLNEIKEIIANGNKSNYDITGFTFYRPIEELKGGDDFLFSRKGNQFSDLCHYFAYVYWPKHNKE